MVWCLFNSELLPPTPGSGRGADVSSDAKQEWMSNDELATALVY